VPDYQLSLAIGKEGQNARLAARLTGWRIDIRPDTAPDVRPEGTPRTTAAPPNVAVPEAGAPSPDTGTAQGATPAAENR
jgi:N utilization substance protein A